MTTVGTNRTKRRAHGREGWMGCLGFIKLLQRRKRTKIVKQGNAIALFFFGRGKRGLTGRREGMKEGGRGQAQSTIKLLTFLWKEGIPFHSSASIA